MPRVPQEHLDARRRQIVEAALRCFARNGIHPTSMQDIFREAGLSAGAVYRYFPTKESLVVAVVEQTVGMSEAAVRPVGEWESGSATARPPEPPGPDAFLSGLLEVFADPSGPGEEQDRFRLVLQIWAEAMRSPQVRETLRRSVDRLRAIVAGQIRAGQATGALRPELDSPATARAVTALFEGYAFQRALEPEIDTEAYVRAVRALLAGGLERERATLG